MNLCFASYRYFADGRVSEPFAESDPANMAYALGGSYLSFYTLKSLSDRQLARRLEPYDWVIVALDVEAMELVRRIVELCAGRAATYSEGHVADYQRLSPAGQVSFVRAAGAARVNFLYWEKYVPFFRALTPAPAAYLPYPYQLYEVCQQRVPVEGRPALAALPSGLAGSTRNGLASWTVARRLLRDGLIDRAAGWLERGTFLEDAHALRYFLLDQPAPPPIAPSRWDWRKWLVLLRIDFRPFLRLHRRLPRAAQQTTVPQALEMERLTLFARQGWPQYIRQLAPARLMIELNNRETVGRNALDCAALGIPYVSTTRSDLAARLFPETVVADSWDVDGAVQLCKRLLADAAFYQRVTAYAADAVQAYDMARFQPHFSRLAAQYPAVAPSGGRE